MRFRNCCYATINSHFNRYIKEQKKNRIAICAGCQREFSLFGIAIENKGMTFGYDGVFYIFYIDGKMAEIEEFFPYGEIYSRDPNELIENLCTAGLLTRPGMKLVSGGYKDLNEYITDAVAAGISQSELQRDIATVRKCRIFWEPFAYQLQLKLLKARVQAHRKDMLRANSGRILGF